MMKSGRALWAAGLLLVLALSAWARLAVYPKVLLNRLSPANGDSEYHLRRMLLAWEQFPRLSVFDPLLGWPGGAAHPWAPGYDWVAAAVLQLTGSDDAATLALAAACFPVGLGLIAVVAVVVLARRVLPADTHPAAALAAGLLAGLVPQFVATSRLARTDHHVWEAMSLVLLTLWALEGMRPVARGMRFELVGLLLGTVTLAGFSGGPLYVALVLPLLAWRPLVEGPTPFLGTGACALGGTAFLAALINLGPIHEHGRWVSFGYPSLLQPVLALGAAAAVTLAWAIGRWRASMARRIALLVALVAASCLVALLLPGLGPQVRGGLAEWLFKKDPWLSGISEFQPLFGLGRAPLDALLFYLGLTGVAAGPLLALAWTDRERRTRELAGFTFVFVALGALTLLQMRFGRVWAPLLGVGAVLGLATLARRWPSAGTAVLALGVVVLTLADPEVRRELELADARQRSPIEAIADGLALERAARPAQGDGVLASWEYGHTLISRAGRPVIASGFGSYVDAEGFEASERAFDGSEAELLALMARRDLGVVVTGVGQLIKHEGAPLLRRTASGLELNPEALRRRPLLVLAQGGSGVPGVAPHVAHLMPTQASEPAPPVAGLPALWSFERVRGLEVTRACTPGGLLIARLRAAVREQPFEWVAWAACGEAGVATLTLCVPSGVEAAGFRTAPAWEIETASGPEQLVVRVAVIRAGG